MKRQPSTPIPPNVKALMKTFQTAEDKLQKARNAVRAAERRGATLATIRRLMTMADKAQANRDRIAEKYRKATL